MVAFIWGGSIGLTLSYIHVLVVAISYRDAISVAGINALFILYHGVNVRCDTVLYVMLSLLAFELLLKYMKVRDWKIFLKKYWLDVAMVVLIPVFSGVKILKALKLAKKAKIAKYGFKAADKTQKKIRKKKKE